MFVVVDVVVCLSLLSSSFLALALISLLAFVAVVGCACSC